MPRILIDSNIFLDLFTNDAQWADWSAAQVAELSRHHLLVINPIIYAEIAPRFPQIEALEHALSIGSFQREALPWKAAFLAAHCHARYRASGGARVSTLPDFFIGAHAMVADMVLLTRDKARYATYFPTLPLICP